MELGCIKPCRRVRVCVCVRMHMCFLGSTVIFIHSSLSSQSLTCVHAHIYTPRDTKCPLCIEWMSTTSTPSIPSHFTDLCFVSPLHWSGKSSDPIRGPWQGHQIEMTQNLKLFGWVFMMECRHGGIWSSWNWEGVHEDGVSYSYLVCALWGTRCGLAIILTLCNQKNKNCVGAGVVA